MKGRVFLLGLLVVVLAVAGCAGMPAPAANAPQSEVNTGSNVSASQTNLWTTSNRAGNPAFTFDASGVVYEGTENTGTAVLYFDGTNIYRGSNSNGEILFNRDGNTLFVGSDQSTAAYTFEGENIFEGQGTQGAILFNIQDDTLRRGANASGDLVFRANDALQGDVVTLLPVLADQRY